MKEEEIEELLKKSYDEIINILENIKKRIKIETLKLIYYKEKKSKNRLRLKSYLKSSVKEKRKIESKSSKGGKIMRFTWNLDNKNNGITLPDINGRKYTLMKGRVTEIEDKDAIEYIKEKYKDMFKILSDADMKKIDKAEDK